MRETWVRSLGWEDPLEKGKATNSKILAWRILWTVYSVGAQSQIQLSNFHFQILYTCNQAPHRRGTGANVSLRLSPTEELTVTPNQGNQVNDSGPVWICFSGPRDAYVFPNFLVL